MQTVILAGSSCTKAKACCHFTDVLNAKQLRRRNCYFIHLVTGCPCFPYILFIHERLDAFLSVGSVAAILFPWSLPPVHLVF